MSKLFFRILFGSFLAALVSAADAYDPYTTLSDASNFIAILESNQNSDTVIGGGTDNSIYVYSVGNSGVSLSQTITGFANLSSIALSSDGETLFATDLRGNAKIFARNSSGQYVSHQNISAANSSAGCISDNAEYIAFQEVFGTYQIHKLNNTGQYNSFQNITPIFQTIQNCYFLENNTFLVINTYHPQVYKHDGMAFAMHSLLQNNNITILPIMAYRSPYLLQPANDASNNLVVYFHEYNQTVDAWESNFQEGNNLPNPLWNVGISPNHKFITMLGITTSVLKEGSVPSGYSLSNTLTPARDSQFTSDNRFLFVSYSDSTIGVFINCNWNTSGNFYLNTNTSTCEQCIGCLDCGSGGNCNQCDSAKNYFEENPGQCSLCTVSNCRTCDSLTTCSACENGYEAEGNSTCIGTQVEEEEALSLSGGQIAGIAVGSTAFVGVAGVLIWKGITGAAGSSASSTIPMEIIEGSTIKPA